MVPLDDIRILCRRKSASLLTLIIPSGGERRQAELRSIFPGIIRLCEAALFISSAHLEWDGSETRAITTSANIPRTLPLRITSER